MESYRPSWVGKHRLILSAAMSLTSYTYLVWIEQPITGTYFGSGPDRL